MKFGTRKSAALGAAILAGALAALPPAASATDRGSRGCPVSYGALRNALAAATQDETTGLDMNMWGTVVDRDGVVCAVAFTGGDRGAQWPGSRVISAQKANTANAFSLDALSLSTANLYSAVQPGGSLFGLQESNPVNVQAAYAGSALLYGTPRDPMVGQKIGGVNVFGGGLALYNSHGEVVGAVGVSGDTSCADHRIGWRTRNYLGLDYVPAGVSGDSAHPDNMVFDIAPNPKGGTGISAGGFGHPHCSDNDGDPGDLPGVPSVTAHN